MTTTDIRDWGREHGWELGDRGKLPADLRAAYANAQAGVPSVQPTSGAPAAHVFEPPSAPDVSRETTAPEPEPAPEQPPVEPPRKRRTVRDLIPKPEQPKGKPRRRARVSLETVGSLLWGGAARVSVQLGEKYMPVSKMMAFQAPVAGMVFEDGVRGTGADRVLQPIARVFETGSEVGTLVGAPFLVGLTCARPDLYPMTRPMLQSMMKEWVIIAGPKLRKMREREEKFAEEMQTFGQEFGMTIDMVLDEIFEGFVEQPQAQAAADRAAANGQPG